MRDTEHKWGRGRETGRHRIPSRLQVLSCQHTAWCGARARKPRDHDLSRSGTLNWLSHPGAPGSHSWSAPDFPMLRTIWNLRKREVWFLPVSGLSLGSQGTSLFVNSGMLANAVWLAISRMPFYAPPLENPTIASPKRYILFIIFLGSIPPLPGCFGNALWRIRHSTPCILLSEHFAHRLYLLLRLSLSTRSLSRASQSVAHRMQRPLCVQLTFEDEEANEQLIWIASHKYCYTTNHSKIQWLRPALV